MDVVVDTTQETELLQSCGHNCSTFAITQENRMSINNLGDLMRSTRDQRKSAEDLYKELFDAVVEAIEDEDAEVRAAAAEALGILADRDAIPHLKESCRRQRSRSP